MDENFLIRSLNSADAPSIAKLHYESFKNFFLTGLGNAFLRSFYNAILSADKGIGIGAFCDDQLVGFAVGTLKTAGFFKSLLFTNGISMGLAAFPKLLFNPSKIKKLATSLSNTPDASYSGSPSLLSICVHPDFASKGIGKILIAQFEKKLISEGYNDLILTTDHENNDYVNQFYIRNYYSCVRTFYKADRKMNLYYKKIK